MPEHDTEILVIGGGATGTGLVRDLAMRGFKTILVERRDLTDGTSGRYHGLLHSGGRYAVKDPVAARECIEENRILRRIMPDCIEATDGFFVQTPGDDPDYAERWLAGCQEAGIPVEEISIPHMLRREPRLSTHITRCFQVPDGAADSFLAARQNAASARAYGAQILRYHPVVRLLVDDHRRVTGALCRNSLSGEDVEITADLVINAAGAWCGKVAETIGVTVRIVPGKGTMLAVAHRVVNTVVNRLKMPGDGDILVPAHTVAVIGTTDIKVPDPDQIAIEPWEVQLMLDEGEKIIPGFTDFRFLRAWAGVRPLYQESSQQAGNREITRAFVLLDHETRDGVPGLLTITGGKWTTYRKMAEVTADKACEKLGVERACRTHSETLATDDRGGITTHNTSTAGHPSLGHRLANIEHDQAYGELLCECELATRQDIHNAISAGEAVTLDDIRREVRLGMGPCQGGFCTLRATGMIEQATEGRPAATVIGGRSANLLQDFLQERWKGIIPIAWGQQLRQERLNELIYLDVLNVDHLPGDRGQMTDVEALTSRQPSEADQHPTPVTRRSSSVVVIGGGLAGLTAAWQAANRGDKVKLITTGWGATHWASGCIDVLGYSPAGRLILSPAEALADLAREEPRHPYALAGASQVDQAIRSFQALAAASGYPLHGDPCCNWLLPTALGTLRPTCLAPETMVAGDIHRFGRMLLVGFEQFLDFWPGLAATNLHAQGIAADWLVLDLPSLQERRFVNGMTLARLFDEPEFRQELIRILQPRLGAAQRVGFPAVLGLRLPLEAVRHLQEGLGLPVFEVPGLPPSIPGIRLHTLLVEAIRKAGGQVTEGMTVDGQPETDDGRILAVYSQAAARRIPHRAERFILATGGILGGGVQTRPDGSIIDTALGLPISGPERADWLQPAFLEPGGHPIFKAGLAVNEHLQPIGPDGGPIYDNLFAVGGALGNCDRIRERSLEGVAVVTGWMAGYD